MQNKKHLLITFSVLISMLLFSGICYAYQTVLIKFHDDREWVKVYNQTKGNEHIVQFVPPGQSYKNWTETYIFHSYKFENFKGNATTFLGALTRKLQQQNNTKPYVTIKRSNNDAIATRCIASNNFIKSQCDIYRVTMAQEAVISIQYINKNTSVFKSNYNKYLESVSEANPYYSYFSHDRIMSKGTSFEL